MRIELQYLPTATRRTCLNVHLRTLQDDEAQPKDTWAYVGRHRSHGKAITGLEFGTREDGRVSLVSVGEDRCLVEYNLPESNQVRSSEASVLIYIYMARRGYVAVARNMNMKAKMGS